MVTCIIANWIRLIVLYSLVEAVYKSYILFLELSYKYERKLLF